MLNKKEEINPGLLESESNAFTEFRGSFVLEEKKSQAVNVFVLNKSM